MAQREILVREAFIGIANVGANSIGFQDPSLRLVQRWIQIQSPIALSLDAVQLNGRKTGCLIVVDPDFDDAADRLGPHLEIDGAIVDLDDSHRNAGCIIEGQCRVYFEDADGGKHFFIPDFPSQLVNRFIVCGLPGHEGITAVFQARDIENHGTQVIALLPELGYQPAFVVVDEQAVRNDNFTVRVQRLFHLAGNAQPIVEGNPVDGYRCLSKGNVEDAGGRCHQRAARDDHYF